MKGTSKKKNDEDEGGGEVDDAQNDGDDGGGGTENNNSDGDALVAVAGRQTTMIPMPTKASPSSSKSVLAAAVATAAAGTTAATSAAAAAAAAAATAPTETAKTKKNALDFSADPSSSSSPPPAAAALATTATAKTGRDDESGRRPRQKGSLPLPPPSTAPPLPPPQQQQRSSSLVVLVDDDDDDGNNNNDLTASLFPRSQRRRRRRRLVVIGAGGGDSDEEEGGGGGEGSDALVPPPLRSLQQQISGRIGEAVSSSIGPEQRRAARQLVRRMGDYLAYFTLLTMLVVIPLVLYRALRNRKVDRAAFNSAGVMMIGTVVMSLRLIYLHLTHWYMPEVQKYVVRILWMVPIYSIQSYLSLRFHDSRIYIDCVRDFYEAFVIASFVYYCIEILGGQDALVQILLQKTDADLGQHPWPLCLVLQPWELGIDFLLQCKHGVLQYVVFKVVASILTYFFGILGLYGEGHFSWFVAYPYLAFFQNLSVMYALYSLVMLYTAIRDELEHPVDWKPLGKFLCIKGVVFFTWWQGVLIFYLRAHGVIGDLGRWSSEDVAYGLIDYCVIIEMIGFAMAHSYTFSYKEYLPGRLPPADDGDGGADNGGVSDTCSQQNGLHRRQQSLIVENGPSNSGDNEDDLLIDDSTNGQRRRCTRYRPPATLPQPMNFKEALWSSSLPRETIEDIQRLRQGMRESLMSRRQGDTAIIPQQDISLRTLRGDAPLASDGDVNDNSGCDDDDDNDEDQPETTFV